MQFPTLRILMIMAWLFFTAASLAHALPPAGIGYTIQAGAFRELSNAERLAGKLNRMNLEAVYHKRENGLYAVTFGNFSTWLAGRDTARRLHQEHVINAYFVAEPVKRVDSFSNISSGVKTKPVPTDRGLIAARTAERFVGIPYHWGGNNVVEGLDCSGFIKAVYYLIGVAIPRTSREQYQEGATVSLDAVREGDLVFFGKNRYAVNHVGIYVGGNRFVHAPRRGEPIQVTDLGDKRYSTKFVGARRYVMPI